MNNKPFTDEEFKSIYSKVPRLCVDPIVRTKDGIVLALRTLPTWNNMWHLPGGTVLYKESIKDAISRVMKREIGAEVEVVKILGYIEYVSEEKERGYGYSVSLAILCDLKGGELKADEDASEVKVFSELPENIVSEQKEFLIQHWSEIF